MTEKDQERPKPLFDLLALQSEKIREQLVVVPYHTGSDNWTLALKSDPRQQMWSRIETTEAASLLFKPELREDAWGNPTSEGAFVERKPEITDSSTSYMVGDLCQIVLAVPDDFEPLRYT